MALLSLLWLGLPHHVFLFCLLLPWSDRVAFFCQCCFWSLWVPTPNNVQIHHIILIHIVEWIRRIPHTFHAIKTWYLNFKPKKSWNDHLVTDLSPCRIHKTEVGFAFPPCQASRARPPTPQRSRGRFRAPAGAHGAHGAHGASRASARRVHRRGKGVTRFWCESRLKLDSVDQFMHDHEWSWMIYTSIFKRITV